MKKAFILLFPQEEYIGKRTKEEISLFNDCIKKRYLNCGYDFVVVKYKGSDNAFVTEEADVVLEADITFKESTPYYTKEWRYVDFGEIVKQLHQQPYTAYVVGGFHCFDCVEKLANEIYKANKNVLVDSDLTERFWGEASCDGWEIDKFNPHQKLARLLDERYLSTPAILKRAREKYENPIWGVSRKVLDKIDGRIEKEEKAYEEFLKGKENESV